MDKRNKSFSDPLSPALQHISDLIHLRAVSDLLAPGNLSHPRHRANSQLQRANNSFKPTPLRGVVVTSSHPSVPASDTLPQRRGLIQALGADVGLYVHRPVKNSHDQQLTFTELFVKDEMTPVRELPVALTDVIA